MLELDRRPALIVGPTDADDVALVVAHAKERGLPLVIRAGGHSMAGHSTGDEALLLDLSAIRDVEIDAVERTAWADAGVLAGEYTSATHTLSLVTPFGIPDPSALPGSRSAAACAGWCASVRRDAGERGWAPLRALGSPHPQHLPGVTPGSRRRDSMARPTGFERGDAMNIRIPIEDAESELLASEA
jgi:hypothetical protein